MWRAGHAEMGGSYERKDTTSAAPPCGDDLVTYPIGLCEAYFGRYAERLDDAQVRVENQGDCRTAYLWGNKAASCTHAHDYVMGRHRQRQ